MQNLHCGSNELQLNIIDEKSTIIALALISFDLLVVDDCFEESTCLFEISYLSCD